MTSINKDIKSFFSSEKFLELQKELNNNITSADNIEITHKQLLNIAYSKYNLPSLNDNKLQFILKNSIQSIEKKIDTSRELADKITLSGNTFNYHEYPEYSEEKLVPLTRTGIAALPEKISKTIEEIEEIQNTLKTELFKVLDINDFELQLDWENTNQLVLTKYDAILCIKLTESIIIPFTQLTQHSFAKFILNNEYQKQKITTSLNTTPPTENMFPEGFKKTVAQLYNTILTNKDLIFAISPEHNYFKTLHNQLIIEGYQETPNIENMVTILNNFANTGTFKINTVPNYTKLKLTHTDNINTFKLQNLQAQTQKSTTNGVHSMLADPSLLFNEKLIQVNTMAKFTDPTQRNTPCTRCLGAIHPKDVHVFLFDYTTILQSMKTTSGLFLTLNRCKGNKSEASTGFLKKYLPQLAPRQSRTFTYGSNQPNQSRNNQNGSRFDPTPQQTNAQLQEQLAAAQYYLELNQQQNKK